MSYVCDIYINNIIAAYIRLYLYTYTILWLIHYKLLEPDSSNDAHKLNFSEDEKNIYYK